MARQDGGPAAARQGHRHSKRAVMFAIWFNQVSMGVFITVPYTLAAYIVRDFLGGDAAREEDVGRQTGLLAAAASAAQALTSFPMGVVADRVGKRAVLLCANLAAAASVAALGLAPSLRAAMASRFVGGLLTSGNGVAIKSLIGELADGGEQASLMGVMVSGWAVGTAFGPLLGGLLARPCGVAAGGDAPPPLPSSGLCAADGLLRRHPYLLSCLASTALCLAACLNNSALMSAGGGGEQAAAEAATVRYSALPTAAGGDNNNKEATPPLAIGAAAAPRWAALGGPLSLERDAARDSFNARGGALASHLGRLRSGSSGLLSRLLSFDRQRSSSYASLDTTAPQLDAGGDADVAPQPASSRSFIGSAKSEAELVPLRQVIVACGGGDGMVEASDGGGLNQGRAPLQPPRRGPEQGPIDDVSDADADADADAERRRGCNDASAAKYLPDQQRGAARAGGGDNNNNSSTSTPSLRPWHTRRALLAALAGSTLIVGVFNAADELTPLFASAPLAAGGLHLPEHELALPMAIGGAALAAYSLIFYPRHQAILGDATCIVIGLVGCAPATMMVPAARGVVRATAALARAHAPSGDDAAAAATTAAAAAAALALSAALVLRSLAKTLALSSSSILINRLTPRRSLGAVNGVGQTLAAAARAAAPALAGLAWALTAQLDDAASGREYLPFAGVAALALLTALPYFIGRGAAARAIAERGT